MKRWETLSRETLFRTPRYTFDHDTFRLPGGGDGVYYSVLTAVAVMVVPVEHDGTIGLGGQYRYFLDADSLDFPVRAVPVGPRLNVWVNRWIGW